MKSFVSRRAMFVLLASIALVLASAASASAAITSSAISSPAQKTVFAYDADAPIPTFSVAGTTVGTGNVDIRCYQGTNTRNLASNVPVVGNAFNATGIDVDALTSGPCILRAIPTGVIPVDKSPFAATIVSTSYTERNMNTNAVLYDYYVFAGQFTGAFDYDSASGCGVDDSYLYNQTTYAYSTQFYCNQWLQAYNATSTASTILVGDKNAYLPASAQDRGLKDSSGFPALTFTSAFDPATGDMTITESNPVVVCATEVFPATDVNCPTLVATGIRLDRTMTQNHDGLVSRVSDTWVNTTAAAQKVNFEYEQDMCMRGPGESCTAQARFSFPDGSSVTAPTNGQALSGPMPSPSTINIANAAVPEGDMVHGRAAITTFPGPDSVVGISVRDIALKYQREIPAGGSVRVDGIFTQAFTQAQLDGLNAEAIKALTPQPTIVAAGKASAKFNKKKIVLDSGQAVSCPALGAACAINASLATTVKLPPKKAKKKSKKKKKAKPRYKTYKFGSFVATGLPGSTTAVTFTLSKTGVALLKKYKKLTFTSVIDVTAGPNAAANQTVKFTVKQPKAKKKPKKKKKK